MITEIENYVHQMVKDKLENLYDFLENNCNYGYDWIKI